MPNQEGWPKAFIQFLKRNDINPEIYNQEPDRYFLLLDERRKAELASQLPEALEVASRPNFFTLPGHRALAHLPLYRQGAILAIDPASLLAVENLNVSAGDHVLDLCCAPGAKLCWLARQGVASVTGVDLSSERLGATVAMAKRYHLGNVRLFKKDGRNFATPPHIVLSTTNDGNELKSSKIVEYERNDMPFWCSSAFRKQPGRLLTSPWNAYDKVLVDAQCTHDGSIKHVRKHISTDWKYFETAHYEEAGLQKLYDLQLSLLRRGFALLKVGGLLVYSTCSLSFNQNERIIEQFLDEIGGVAIVETPRHGLDYLVELDGNRGMAVKIDPSAMRNATEHGLIQSGFFFCLLRKVQ